MSGSCTACNLCGLVEVVNRGIQMSDVRYRSKTQKSQSNGYLSTNALGRFMFSIYILGGNVNHMVLLS